MTDAEYLRHQANLSKAAISTAFGQLKSTLRQGANPLNTAKSHPWATLTAAVAGGFVGSLVLFPSHKRKAMAKLEAIELALKRKQGMEQPLPRESPSRPSSHSSLLRMVIDELMVVIQPVLAEAITFALMGATPRQNSNGAPPEPGNVAAAAAGAASTPTN